MSDSRTAKYVRVRAVGQSKCPSEGQSDSQSVPVRDNRTVKVSQWGTVGQSKCPSDGQTARKSDRWTMLTLQLNKDMDRGFGTYDVFV